jgi:hypothetical protein
MNRIKGAHRESDAQLFPKDSFGASRVCRCHVVTPRKAARLCTAACEEALPPICVRVRLHRLTARERSTCETVS